MANKQFKCPCCGGSLQFDDKSQNIVCPYCDSQFTPESLKDYTDELASQPQEDTSWDESMVQAYTNEEKKGIKIYSCDSCGGEIIVDETTSSTCCPYCGNNVLVSKELAGDLKPNYVIPFKNDREVVKENLKKFFKKKPLLPSSFSKENVIEEIKPLYVPFWLFDADVSGTVEFKGETTKRWSDSYYDYKETKVYSILRGGNIAFDHVPVDGSKKMEDQLMESIEPYDFNEAVEFNAAYLAGYAADRYDVDKETTFDRATVRFRDGTVQAFRRDVSGYDNVSVTNTNLQFNNTNAAYALYPVWILNTKWKDKSFRFAVNGQTGKIAGNLPVSVGKAFGFWFLFFFIFLAVIGGIFGGILFANSGEISGLLIGLGIGAVFGIIFATIIVLAMRRKNKNVKFEYGASNYVRDNSFGINYRKSIYLYSRVSKTRRAQNK
ncbi:MAG: hypothetical protein J5511_03930 [Bacilli bacterium]|nr:hypothetical protein [Bacilli bacterium]